MKKEYKPFGEEWEKEMNQLPKKMLIDLYRNACLLNIENLPVEAGVMQIIAGEIEKGILETQLVEIKVLQCNGDIYGNNLPAKILLQMGNETKWFIKAE